MSKMYNFQQLESGRWVARHGKELICGSYPTQEDAVIGLARYIETERLRENLYEQGVDAFQLMLKSREELLEIEKSSSNTPTL